MDPKIKATIPMAAFWMENTPTGSAVPSAICDTMAVEQRLNNNRNNINNNRTIRKPDKDEKVFDALCIPDNGSFFDGS